MRLVLALALLAGCAKDITSSMEELADRACTCAEQQKAKPEAERDPACGRAILTDLAKLVEGSKNVKGDEPRVAASGKKLGECLVRSGVKPLEISEAINKLNTKSAPPPAEGAPKP